MGFACTFRFEGEIRKAKVIVVTFTTDRKEKTKLKWILWRCIVRIGGGWNLRRIFAVNSVEPVDSVPRMFDNM